MIQPCSFFSLYFCSGRKENPSTCLAQTGAPAHGAQTGQAHPLHDQSPLPIPSPCSSQAALCNGPTDQLTPLLPPFQHSQPAKCKATEPVFPEPPHPADPHYTTDTPDSRHSQPDPATCQAPSLLHWGRVSGQWDDGRRGHSAGPYDDRLRCGCSGASEAGGDECVAGRRSAGRGG